MNYLNMGNVSKIFNILDMGGEPRITCEEFGEDFQQVAIDIAIFLNKHNRPTMLKPFQNYVEIGVYHREGK